MPLAVLHVLDRSAVARSSLYSVTSAVTKVHLFWTTVLLDLPSLARPVYRIKCRIVKEADTVLN